MSFPKNSLLRSTVLGALSCAFTVLLGSAQAQAQTYQASTGFSSTQGQNQWHYQYWNGSAYLDMTWDAANGYWSGPGSYLIVGPGSHHPGSYHDSALKWVAPQAGTVSVTGQVKKSNVLGGDGVNVRVLHNSAVLFDQNVAYDDTTGYAVSLTVQVSAGDALYFVVNRRAEQQYDGVAWDPSVSYTGGPPPSGAQWQYTNSNAHYTAGSVGIGKTNPSTALDVVGGINATGTITGGVINAKYQDLAEWVPSTMKLSAGTVVVLDQARTNHVLASRREYDTSVAGVISAQPGIALGEAGEGKVLVATTGRVLVRVDASKGAIRVGDLLVTSDVEGLAMKSRPLKVGGRLLHAPGTIIGKALEPLAGGRGEILVLLSLQ